MACHLPFGLASVLSHAAIISSSPDWSPMGKCCSSWFRSVTGAADQGRFVDVFGDGRYWSIALEAVTSLVGGNHGHRGNLGKTAVTSLQVGEAWVLAVCFISVPRGQYAYGQRPNPDAWNPAEEVAADGVGLRRRAVAQGLVPEAC